MRKKLGRFVSLGLVGVMVMSTLITGCGASGEDDVASGSAVEEVTEEETEEVAEEPEEQIICRL